MKLLWTMTFCALVMGTAASAEFPEYGYIIPLASPDPGANYGPAGISNAGNVFGRVGGENVEQGVQWLASTGYEAEQLVADPELFPTYSRGFQPNDVNGAGIATGRAIEDGWDMFKYNVDTQTWYNLGGGEGHGSNSAGKGVDDKGGVYLQDGTQVGADLVGNPWDINDHDVIVGWTSSPRQAALWKPSAVDAHDWGEVVVLPELANLDTRAYNISDSDPGFAAGISMDGIGIWHGMVWNTETEALAADFGMDTQPTLIHSAGTMVAGSSGGSAALCVRTADDWTTWEELDPNTLLASVDGGADWESLDNLAGVNDSGQLVGTGRLDGGDRSPFVLSTGEPQVAGMGDADRDSDVDDDDLSLLLANWGSPTAGWGQGEFNGVPPVDDDDLSLLLANWTGSLGEAIPEPTTLALLALGGLALRRRRT